MVNAPSQGRPFDVAQDGMLRVPLLSLGPPLIRRPTRIFPPSHASRVAHVHLPSSPYPCHHQPSLHPLVPSRLCLGIQASASVSHQLPSLLGQAAIGAREQAHNSDDAELPAELQSPSRPAAQSACHCETGAWYVNIIHHLYTAIISSLRDAPRFLALPFPASALRAREHTASTFTTAAPSMETPLRARATPTPHPQTSVAGHKRKISYADLAATYRAAGPMVAPGPPHASMHQQPSLTQAQMHQAHLDELRRRELAKRQSRKPTDRDIPHDVAEAVVGDGVARYGKLRDAEKKLDALMMRKRLDVKDNAQREYARREGVLRVWISNTVEGQPWQVIADEENEAPFELGENSQATFRVKIEGRLIDDEAGEDDEKDKPSTEKRPRLSSFFKAITIDFDRNPALMPDGHSQIEWRKQPPPGQHGGNPQAYDPNSKENSFDTLEFERKGDENVNVTISLIRDSERERFKLSPGLAELLDSEEEDMLGAVQGVWEYARAMRLQEDEDKRTIVCDDALRNVCLICNHTKPGHTCVLTFEIAALQPTNPLFPVPSRSPPTPPASTTSNPTEVHHPRRQGLPQRPTANEIRPPRPSPEPDSALHSLLLLHR